MKATNRTILQLSVLIFASCNTGNKEVKTNDTVEQAETKTESATTVNHSYSDYVSVTPKITNDMDEKLKHKLKAQLKLEEFMVLAIESTKEYKELTKNLEENIIKNGGSGFYLSLEDDFETALNDSVINKGDFTFVIAENYPDKITRTQRFVFSLWANEDEPGVSLYDVAEDKLVPINIDYSFSDKLTDYENIYSEAHSATIGRN